MIAQKAADALGYTQITNVSAAVGVGTIPAGSERVILQAETQNVRYRDDGTDPTSSTGFLLVTNTIYEFNIAQIARMKFIEATASAKLNIGFYGTKVTG